MVCQASIPYGTASASVRVSCLLVPTLGGWSQELPGMEMEWLLNVTWLLVVLRIAVVISESIGWVDVGRVKVKQRKETALRQDCCSQSTWALSWSSIRMAMHQTLHC